MTFDPLQSSCLFWVTTSWITSTISYWRSLPSCLLENICIFYYILHSKVPKAIVILNIPGSIHNFRSTLFCIILISRLVFYTLTVTYHTHTYYHLNLVNHMCRGDKIQLTTRFCEITVVIYLRLEWASCYLILKCLSIKYDIMISVHCLGEDII